MRQSLHAHVMISSMEICVKIVSKPQFHKYEINFAVIPSTPVINCTAMLNSSLFQQNQTVAALSCYKYLTAATATNAVTTCSNLRTNTTTQKSRLVWIQNKATFDFMITMITVSEAKLKHTHCKPLKAIRRCRWLVSCWSLHKSFSWCSHSI
jgi:hypothetical protein